MNHRSTLCFRAAFACATLPVFAAFVFATPARAADKIELKLKFSEGKSRFIETTRKMKQSIDLAGQPMNQDIDTTDVVLESVESVKDDVATIKMTFDRKTMNVKSAMMPGGGMAFDSDKPDADSQSAQMIGPIFGGMIGQSMMMKLGSDGKVHEFSGMDKIREDIAKKAGMNPIWMQMQGQLNDEAARVEYAEGRYDFLPGKPVAKGDEWAREIARESPGIGKTISNIKYQFADIAEMEHGGTTRRVAVIEYTGTMKSGDDADAAPAGRPRPKIESSEFHGTVKFDIERGHVLVDERSVKMKLMLKGGPMGDMGIDATSDERFAVLPRKERVEQKEKAKSDASKNDEKDKSDSE